MSTKEECECAKCAFGQALRDATIAFMDRAQAEGCNMVEAGTDLLRILSFEMGFQATAVTNAANDPPAMAARLSGAIGLGSAKGAEMASRGTIGAREVLAAVRPH